MARLVVMYRTPADAAAFDRHYEEVHFPIALGIPGLERYDISRGPVSSASGASAYHLVATLEFESLNALQQGMGSPEGRAAADDLKNFAGAGVDMLIFRTEQLR